MNSDLDYGSIRKAVEAVLTSSDTLCVGIRDSLKRTDMNAYFNYEHGRHIQELSEEINNKLQDFIGEIERMEEERKEASIAEKEDQEFFAKRCGVCGGEGEHDWEVHVAEMKATSGF